MSDLNVVFVIPLAIGLVATYIAKKFNDDLAYLGIVIAILSLILGIVLAPWQIQLILFALVFVGTRQLWKSNGNNSQPEEFTAETIGKSTVTSSPSQVRSPSNGTDGKMIRKYRGISYEVPVAPEPKPPEEIGGMYRGNPWKTNNSQGMIETPRSHSDLKYRGVRWTLEAPQKLLNLVRDRGN